MNQARDQGLIGNSLLDRLSLNAEQVVTAQADVDPLVLPEGPVPRFLEHAQQIVRRVLQIEQAPVIGIRQNLFFLSLK